LKLSEVDGIKQPLHLFPKRHQSWGDIPLPPQRHLSRESGYVVVSVAAATENGYALVAPTLMAFEN